MADEVEMTPVAGAEPPKADPLMGHSTTKAASAPALRPGLKLPPKPGSTLSMMRPGLKLPTQTALKPGVKLPPKSGGTVSMLRPGLKLPTQTALKPGVRLPVRPQIRKPGTVGAVAPLPKPVTAAPTAAASAAPVAPAKPIAIDAQGVGKLPTVSATSIPRGADVSPVVSDLPKPMEALKAATQRLKGITQEIPQQAILHKTGIIADGAVSDLQKEAAKHKTARISLADAMGVAPVKDENAPMKTIRIRRPIDIPTTTTSASSAPAPAASTASTPAASAAAAAPTAQADVPELKTEPAPQDAKATAAPTSTQRKTLKIARPSGGVVRPTGKFGVKRPLSTASTVVKKAPTATASASAPAADNAAVADIPDIPNLSAAPVPMPAPVSEGSSLVYTWLAIVQLAACVAIGALAWFLWENTQTSYF